MATAGSSPRLHLALWWLLVPFTGMVSAAELTTGHDRLQPGAAQQRTLAPGQSDHFELQHATAQYLWIEVKQQEIDVVLRLHDRHGAVVDEQDMVLRHGATEHLYRVLEAGRSQLEVLAKGTEQGPGRYRITLQVQRPAGPSDRDRARAEQTYEEAVALLSSGRDVARARRLFEQVLPAWQHLGDAAYEASVLDNLGTCWQRLDNLAAAIDAFAAAIPAWQRAGLRGNEASTWINLGVAQHEQRELKAARQSNRQAISILQASDASHKLAIVLNNQAMVDLDLGLLDEARELLEEAIELRRAAGGEQVLARSLANLGHVLTRAGEIDAAITSLERALVIAREAGDDETEAAALANLGVAYEWSGEPLAALEQLRAALAINRRRGNRRGQAEVQRNLGTAYLNLGDLTQALRCYQQAADLNRELGRHEDLANALINAGWAAALQDRPQLALADIELAIAALENEERPAALAFALEKLGRVNLQLGRLEAARSALDRALDLAKAAGFQRREAKVRLALAELWQQTGELPRAITSLQRAGILGERAGDLLTTIDALAGLARCFRSQGRLDAARQQIELALDLVESVRARAGGQRLRASFLAARADLYELAVDLAMAQHRQSPGAGFDRTAFGFHQRLRSRSLLDLVAGSDLPTASSADNELLRQERQLRRQLNAAELRLELLETRVEATAEQRRRLLAEQDDLVRRYDELRGRARDQSRRISALTEATPLPLAEIQAEVLDQETVLLVYALGEQRSVVWSVGKDRLAVAELPSRTVIEAACERLGALLVLPAGRSQVMSLDKRQALESRLEEAERELRAVADELRGLLLDPVASALAGKRIAVMADGALQQLPFSMLPSPVAEERGRPLITSHEVVVLPSASVLGLTRRRVAGRPSAPRLLAVLADPVLSADDDRLAAAGGTATARQMAATGLRGAAARLPYAGSEAVAITTGLDPDQVLVATGAAASRDLVLGGGLSGFRIVHFATHSLLHPRHPELSCLQLASFDQRGRPCQGCLALHEISSLHLDAELVVLSACRSGLGQQIRGEGLISLARGFFHAGAPRVVASLWPVNDTATAELMARFYQQLLHHQARPAAALRHAQLSMLQDTSQTHAQWHHPFYWAGFVLHGDWR